MSIHKVSVNNFVFLRRDEQIRRISKLPMFCGMELAQWVNSVKIMNYIHGFNDLVHIEL